MYLMGLLLYDVSELSLQKIFLNMFIKVVIIRKQLAQKLDFNGTFGEVLKPNRRSQPNNAAIRQCPVVSQVANTPQSILY